MQLIESLKQLFNPPACETPSQKLGRHIDALKQRDDFFVFDGSADTGDAKTQRLVRIAELVNNEPVNVYAVDLQRINHRRPQGGDRVVLEGADKVKRLYVMYDIRETDNFPALAPVLRAVLMDDAAYQGGYGQKGQFRGEFDSRPLDQHSPALRAEMKRPA